MIRVVLPAHLRNLARAGSEVQLDIGGEVTVSAILDALEAGLPDPARHHSRSGYAPAPPIRPILRLRGGPFARCADGAAAGRGGVRCGAVFDCGGDCRGQVRPGACDLTDSRRAMMVTAQCASGKVYYLLNRRNHCPAVSPMPLSFRKPARGPWPRSSSNIPVFLKKKGGLRGRRRPRACPTIYAEFPAAGKLSGIGL